MIMITNFKIKVEEKLMKTIKYSRHREAIIKFLMTRKDHPTAEVIYNNIREEYPKISLGTVYRNLTLLADTGQIQRIPCRDSSDHFDGNAAIHPHFVCNECMQVIDLEMDSLNFLNTLASQNFDGIIETHQLIFYGVCSECKMKIAENSKI